MNKEQRVKQQMFGRVRNFGIANKSAFPEETVAGRKFGQLIAIVDQVEAELVRQEQARGEGRKLKQVTKDAAVQYMKEMASTGRRASVAETGPHMFRMPQRRSFDVVLTTGRLFMAEAEKRKEKFIELGMPATFITDFGAVVNALADAVERQQDSRAARRLAAGAIQVALDAGMELVADLDATVQNVFRANPAKLAEWSGARRVDYPAPSTDATATTPASSTVSGAPAASEIATSDPASATGKEGEVKVAS